MEVKSTDVLSLEKSMIFECWFGQALSLSDNALNRLGVVRENVDDTAGAAQVHIC